MDHHRYSNGGRPQQQQQQHQSQQQQQQSSQRRALRLGTKPLAGYLHSQPKVTPPILQSSNKADFGEDFIDLQRRNRLVKGSGSGSVIGRARSEVAEILSNNGNPRLNASHYHHRRDGSYNDDNRRSVHTFHSTAKYYDRPRSSFEPASAAMNSSTHSATAAPRIVRNRQDDWQEVERRNNQGQYSTDEEFDEEEIDSAEDEELREELEMYNRRGNSAANYNRQPNNSSYYSSRHSRQDFSESDLYFFGVIHLSPQQARQIVTMNSPPNEFWNLPSVEKAAYLYYFSLYKKYISSIKSFHNIFNREFYKYTAAGDKDNEALLRICKHTRDEFDRKRQSFNKQAYDRSRQHLFSDDRATPDSRATSYCEQLDESDILSVDSAGAKEPHKFTKPHAFASFAVGGKLLVLNPEFSISTIQVEDVKNRIRDRGNRRNIDAMENFKGPLIIDETPSHTPLLFIERQIQKIIKSEIYQQNNSSSDANDVLLIWRLLEMLIRQHGNVTGPDLARLLTTNYSFSLPPIKPTRGKATNEHISSSSTNRDTASPMYMYSVKDERRVDPRAMDKYTQFLLGGYIDDAIESAINDGLLFDALILAYRMYGNDRQKLDPIESKLLTYRDPKHPALTLLSVASEMPVPILSNMSAADDTNGWRAHIAIVLANLKNETAIFTVHQLGLALSRKEFNAAADFCFLAVNLLTSNYDCFAPVQTQQSDDEEPFRRHITLINASLPDDEFYSTKTRYGWSIIDFQATEIYDFALKMSKRPINGGLSDSSEYQKCRLEYAQMLAEYGGAATSAFKYCQSIAQCIWANSHQQTPKMLNDLCDLGDRLHCVANQTTEQLVWAIQLRKVADELLNNQYVHQQQKPNSLGQQLPPMPLENFVQLIPLLNPLGLNSIPPPVSTELLIAATPDVHEEHKNHVVEQPSILPSYDPHQEEQMSPRFQQQRRFSLLNDNSRKSSYDHSQHQQQPVLQPPMTPPFRQTEPAPKPMVLDHPPMPKQEHPQQPQPPMQIQQPQHSNQMQLEMQQQQPPKSPPMQSQQQMPPQPLGILTSTPVKHSDIQQQHSPPQQQPQQYFQQPITPPAHHPQMETKQYVHEPTPSMLQQQPQHVMQPQNQPQQYLQQQPQRPMGGGGAQEMPKQQPSPQQQNQDQQQQQQSQKKQTPPSKGSSGGGSGGGFFSGITKKIAKYVPSGKEMKLPDDSDPNKFRFDEKLGRWVGEGVEEVVAPPPPPSMPMSAAAPTMMPDMGNVAVASQSLGNIGNDSNATSPGPTRASFRRNAGPRYANSFASATSSSPMGAPSLAPEGFNQPLPNAMMPQFFMPTVPDDYNENNDEASNPFSSGPTEPEKPNQ